MRKTAVAGRVKASGSRFASVYNVEHHDLNSYSADVFLLNRLYDLCHSGDVSASAKCQSWIMESFTIFQINTLASSAC